MELKITIKNIKENQAVAFAQMLDHMMYNGYVGTTEYVGFLVDGDGDFHPQIETNINPDIRNKYAKYTKVYADGKSQRKTNDPNDKLIEDKFPWTQAITLYDYNDFKLTDLEIKNITGGGI